MIPVLYKTSVTPWQWGTFLRDLVSCTVTEELNGNYILEAVLPASSPAYQDLDVGGVIEAKCRNSAIKVSNSFTSGDVQYFRIYYIGRPINGKVTIKAEHQARYTIKNTIILPGAAASSFSSLPKIVPATGVDLDMPVYFTSSIGFFPARKVPIPLIDYMEGTEDSIVDNRYGCNFLYDAKHPAPEGGAMPRTQITVPCIYKRGITSRYEVRYGVNMSDFLHEIDDSSQICGVFPYYYTEPSSDEETATYIAPTNAVYDTSSRTGKVVILDVTQEFSDSETLPTVAQITAKATEWLELCDDKAPKINIKVNFVPVYAAAGRGGTIPKEVKAWLDAATLNVGDTINVIHDRLGITAKARINSIVYDVLKDRVTTMEVGDAKPRLPKTLAAVFKKTGVRK